MYLHMASEKLTTKLRKIYEPLPRQNIRTECKWLLKICGHNNTYYVNQEGRLGYNRHLEILDRLKSVETKICCASYVHFVFQSMCEHGRLQMGKMLT